MTRNPLWRPSTVLSTPAMTIVIVVTALLAGSPRLVSAGRGAPNDDVTFARDIAPILQRSCQRCHRPGSVAPMSLITYEEVRPWVRSMKFRTGLRNRPGVMPPWFVEKDIGIQKFKNDPSLSEEEIATIATWVDSGAPRGNTADMPPPLTFSDESHWEIGEPDLILTTPSVEIAAGAPDWWGPIGDVPTGLAEDRYVAAVEMREINDLHARVGGDTVGGRFVFHHLCWGTLGGDGETHHRCRHQ